MYTSEAGQLSSVNSNCATCSLSKPSIVALLNGYNILHFRRNIFIVKFPMVYIFSDLKVVDVITTPLSILVVQRYKWIRYGKGKQHYYYNTVK